MTKNTNTLDLTKEVSTKLLALMGSAAEVEVKEGEDNMIVDIKTEEETGLLIGRKGETLDSLQTVLSLIIRTKIGEWPRIIVNVGDWKEKQDFRLKELANQVAQRAIETNEPQPLYNLNPAQRRIIHLELSQNNAVTTESEGEGDQRYLVVAPKAKLSDKNSS